MPARMVGQQDQRLAGQALLKRGKRAGSYLGGKCRAFIEIERTALAFEFTELELLGPLRHQPAGSRYGGTLRCRRSDIGKQ